MREVTLTSAKGGIDRLRSRGSPAKDVLYDLINAYVNQSGGIDPRAGTSLTITLPEGTIGLTGFDEKLFVFADTNVYIPDDRFELVIIRHPNNPVLTLEKIHFAEPFLGYLYVVAEFIDGSLFHYWIEPLE